MIYSFEFENEYFPAIILDAIDLNKRLVWSRKLTVDDQKEFERLREDGHIFVENKRYFVADLQLNPSRSTQLYRTLLHEFGHYVHYLKVVERPGNADEDYEEKDARENFYFSLPKVEKEKFANKYADNLKAKMTFKKIIPFESK